MKQRMRLIVNVPKVQVQKFVAYIQQNRSSLIVARLASRR